MHGTIRLKPSVAETNGRDRDETPKLKIRVECFAIHLVNFLRSLHAYLFFFLSIFPSKVHFNINTFSCSTTILILHNTHHFTCKILYTRTAVECMLEKEHSPVSKFYMFFSDVCAMHS